jgi:hypothetical protein
LYGDRVHGEPAEHLPLPGAGYRKLMTSTKDRLVEEVARLGGHYAHVYDEAISSKHDDAAGEARCMADSPTAVPPARWSSVERRHEREPCSMGDSAVAQARLR